VGRWAQAKRRTGRVRAAAGPGTPPAPLLERAMEHVVQTAQGLPDVGGLVALQWSPNGVDEWDDCDGAEWEAVHDWGVIPCGPWYYRAKEVGNGTTYLGESPWSDVLDMT
jgi:hypothetical protein